MTHKITVLLLVVICFAIVFCKIHIWGKDIAQILPQRHYDLTLNMQFDGHDNDIQLSVLLPIVTDRQTVKQEVFGSPDFDFHIRKDELNRWGIWNRSKVSGHYEIAYSCVVWSKTGKYKLANQIDIPRQVPVEVEQDLLPAKNTPSDSPEIIELFKQLVPAPDRQNATAIVRAIFDYTSNIIRPIKFKGTTDAITTLRLQEASCGGKSRLFVALCRAGGIPSRLVGGLILKEDTWRSSHIWAEAWLGGRWVPFCPLNGYFAEIPSHYLTLYYRDFSLFTYTRDINFKYYFHAKRILAPAPDATKASAEFPRNMMNLWRAFEQARIPLNLLKIILMMPLGAFVVVLARNIIGIQTFGTFMPALMAVAFRDTGLFWGIILFISILIFVGAIRYSLDRFQLLHTPKLALLMTGTVAFIITIILSSVATGHVFPTRITAFPIVILTLTVERFAIMLEEDGWIISIKVVFGTLVVVMAAFAIMNWERLQIIVVAFPETLLLLVATFIVVGRWTGLRFSEYLRFRELLWVPASKVEFDDKKHRY